MTAPNTNYIVCFLCAL